MSKRFLKKDRDECLVEGAIFGVILIILILLFSNREIFQIKDKIKKAGDSVLSSYQVFGEDILESLESLGRGVRVLPQKTNGSKNDLDARNFVDPEYLVASSVQIFKIYQNTLIDINNSLVEGYVYAGEKIVDSRDFIVGQVTSITNN